MSEHFSEVYSNTPFMNPLQADRVSSDSEQRSAAKEEVTMQGRGTILGQQGYEVGKKPGQPIAAGALRGWAGARGNTPSWA